MGNPNPNFTTETDDVTKRRLGHLKKLYGILAVQFFFTAAAAVIRNQFGPFPVTELQFHYAVHLLPLFALVLGIVPFSLNVKLKLLVPYTVWLSFLVGRICVIENDWFMVKAASVMTIICAVLSRNATTFWAARRRCGIIIRSRPLLLSSLVPLVFLIMQGLVSLRGILAVIAYCGFLALETCTFIKRRWEIGFVYFHISLLLQHMVSYSLLSIFSPMYRQHFVVPFLFCVCMPSTRLLEAVRGEKEKVQVGG